jgi:crotonobetainyl-CoA:carnitine CoA-transferase CaiB-like acyl-CoA transferase
MALSNGPACEKVIRQRPAMGDNTGSMNIAFAIAAALFDRERGGAPATVDVSLLATAMWTLAMDILVTQDEELKQAPSGWHPLTEPYLTADGHWLQLMLIQVERYWQEFCELLGRPDLLTDPRFSDREARQANADLCVAEFGRIFAERTYDEWAQLLAGFSGPWEPMLTPEEVTKDPQVVANSYFPEVAGVGARVVAPPAQFDRTPVQPLPAPRLGEHTDAVLIALGVSPDELTEMRKAGIVA